jgi:hypothetical protein
MVQSLRKDSEARIQLQVKENDLSDKKKVLMNELSSYAGQFQSILGNAPQTAQGLLGFLNAAITSRKNRLELSTEKLQKHQQELSVATSQLVNARK